MFFHSLIKTGGSKFGSDLKWNLWGFSIIALCGISINLLITHYYGFSSLGFFNLLLVFFLVLSQLISWGIPLSVQKFTPQYRHQEWLCKEIMMSALIVTAVFALVGGVLLYGLREIPGIVMENRLLRKGFVHIVAGIGFSVLNRILLSFLNGMRYMKLYAFFNGFRVGMMLLVLVVFIETEVDSEFLGLLFTIPEFLVTLLLFIISWKWFTSMKYPKFWKLFRLHLRYGHRAMLGSVVTNLSTKLDILLLGFLVSNTMVGVYSFAVFVVDGFFQVFYVFRVSINPLITTIFFNRSPALLARFVNRNIKRFYKIFFVLGILLGLFYPGFLFLFNVTEHITTNLTLFYVLLAAVVMGSGFQPFQFFFNQIGEPTEQTKFLISVLFVTGSLILIMVPFLGAIGAALAILLSNLYQVLYLKKGISRNLEKAASRRIGRGSIGSGHK